MVKVLFPRRCSEGKSTEFRAVGSELCFIYAIPSRGATKISDMSEIHPTVRLPVGRDLSLLVYPCMLNEHCTTNDKAEIRPDSKKTHASEFGSKTDENHTVYARLNKHQTKTKTRGELRAYKDRKTKEQTR